tara:strand:+ start:574 stop:1101 length:528 start_codon:yes stop_codon:yes gene_type:complete
MDPVTIAASIAAVKTAMGAAKNIQSIGHSLDGLFKAQEEHKKNKGKKRPKTRMQQILRMRSGDEGYDDDTSISAVANQVLEDKQTEIALVNLAREIDRKYGRGTWNQIIQQRKKLIQERKAADQLAKENALRKAKADKEFWHKVMVESGKILVVVLAVVAVIGFVMWAASQPKIR